MTSNTNANQAYVWLWLPKSDKPIIVGKLTIVDNLYEFMYSRHYRNHPEAIPLSPYELPLISGRQKATGLSPLFSCLRDSGPDAWGRRLIHYQYPELNPNELDYFLKSGSDRIGALDFQVSAENYSARNQQTISINQIEDLALVAENKKTISKDLIPVLYHGTSVGGARPKCIIEKDHQPYLAKFSLSSDQHPIVKSEFIAMKLAKKVGLNVPKVEFQQVLGRDILLVRRFDRCGPDNKQRKIILSALSILGLDELEARYASYVDMADVIRKDFSEPTKTLTEFYNRLVFNILVGNTDDHARNHAAFWDGKQLKLTPAYDICPQLRVGHEATQAMNINGAEGNYSTLTNALSISQAFMIDRQAAIALINQQIKIIKSEWHVIAKAVNLPENDQRNLLGSTILSEYCLLNWPPV